VVRKPKFWPAPGVRGSAARQTRNTAKRRIGDAGASVLCTKAVARFLISPGIPESELPLYAAWFSVYGLEIGLLTELNKKSDPILVSDRACDVALACQVFGLEHSPGTEGDLLAGCQLDFSAAAERDDIPSSRGGVPVLKKSGSEPHKL